MAEPKVALVTGGNRGIGFEVCRQLAKHGYNVVLTSRDKVKGEQAVKDLADQGLKVDFHELDVTDSGSVQLLDAHIRREFKRLDALINNAGVFLDRGESAGLMNVSRDQLRATMETNVYGPLMMIQKFAPLMAENNYGRIVNVSSGLGQLSDMGGGYAAYRMSKVAINAVTRMAADEVKDRGILVNSACPGWVRTDMGGEGAPRSTEEGADTIVWLAMNPEASPTGKFFRDRKEIPW